MAIRDGVEVDFLDRTIWKPCQRKYPRFRSFSMICMSYVGIKPSTMQGTKRTACLGEMFEEEMQKHGVGLIDDIGLRVEGLNSRAKASFLPLKRDRDRIDSV